MTYGAFIRGFRKEKGISGPKMAELIGVNYYRLQKWESEKGSPKYDDLAKISRYFKRNPTEQLGEKELEKALISGYDFEQGVIQMAAEETPAEALLAVKEQRIKELEATVKSLTIALEALQEALKKR